MTPSLHLLLDALACVVGVLYARRELLLALEEARRP